MNFQLNKVEIKEVTQVLDHYRSDLKIETRRTMDYRYKETLNREMEVLNGLLDKFRVKKDGK
ncbi:hypothetical protein A9Q84_00375 [Halobacteriovorax marinus]|uniref:Uncharacterized protein n=1 Tax=Halobacteriovorax marinus TaxID=97084 RepID=A0A1Y5FBM0_9BACT|nr:hypothetical protein A9Q84_00375 [Halobacteriovorax marinus]